MSPIHRYTLCVILVACLLNSVAVESLSLEHSFDGQDFKRVASLDIPEIGDQAPLADYSEALAADASKLLASAQDDKLYYIRVSGVVASIPARCWAKAGSNAQLIINTLDSDAVTAAALLAPCGATVAAPTDDSELTLPRIDTVGIARPVPAPTVNLPAAVGAGAGAQTAAMQQASSAAKGQEEKKKAEPEKDDRTWIQKNWLPLALVAFMMFNRMGAGQQHEGGAPPPGRALPAGASRPPAAR